VDDFPLSRLVGGFAGGFWVPTPAFMTDSARLEVPAFFAHLLLRKRRVFPFGRSPFLFMTGSAYEHGFPYFYPAPSFDTENIVGASFFPVVFLLVTSPQCFWNFKGTRRTPAFLGVVEALPSDDCADLPGADSPFFFS